MRLVKQDNHETCQQACIAMLAGIALDDVVQLVGDRALATSDRRRAFDHFRIKYPEDEAGWPVDSIEKTLPFFMRAHRTLWCQVLDARDPAWGHAVLLHARHLYDPWRGIDPSWPWSRWIWKVMPIEAA